MNRKLNPLIMSFVSISFLFVFSLIAYADFDGSVIKDTEITIGVGQSYTLKIAAGKGITFSSDNASVVSVSDSGTLKGVAVGTACVTARTADGKSSEWRVNVKKAPSSVKLDKTDMLLGVGENYKLKVTLTKNSYSSLSFSSSDKSVAKVTSTGKISAVSPGSANITVKTFNGKKAVCKITVKAQAVSASLDRTEVYLEQGSVCDLGIITVPAEAYYRSVVYSSDNNRIASVSSEGEISALRMGSAVITARITLGDGSNIIKSCNVNVGPIKIPYVDQCPKYPTGCEAASSTMLLQYYGFDITLDEMVETIPRRDITEKDGKRWGPDINEMFVGDPRGTYTSGVPGYGIFSPGLTKAINNAIRNNGGGGYKAEKISGCSFDKLLSYVKSGHPVIVWATYRMQEPSTVNSWYIEETGEYFEYPRGTHVMILTGYSDDTVTIVDPYKSGECTFPKKDFQNKWYLLNRQGIIIKADKQYLRQNYYAKDSFRTGIIQGYNAPSVATTQRSILGFIR